MKPRRRTSTGAGPTARPRHTPARVPAPARVSWRERGAWILVGALLLAGLTYLLRSVIAVLFASFILAWLADPWVDRLEGRGHSRERALGLLFGGIAAAFALGLLVVVPSVAVEFARLGANFGGYVNELHGALDRARLFAETQLGRPIPLTASEVLAELQRSIAAQGGTLGQVIQDAGPDLGSWVASAAAGVLQGGWSVVVAVLNLSLVPIFTFYMARDWDRMLGAVDELLPPRARGAARGIARSIDERLASFVRGQLTVCAALAVLYSVGLLIAGIDLALVVGITSGALFIVPYLGTVFGVVAASALALLKFGVDWHLVAVWVTFGVAQALEGMVLTPLIVGDRVGLHPAVVMVALLVGGNLFGLTGMLLAIPVTAAGHVLLAYGLEQYRASGFFGQPDA